MIVLLEDKKCWYLVAQEAKYHLNCLTTVYNRERAFFRQQRENDQNEQERHAYSRAFAELVTYIIESQRSHQGESFFTLADLNDLMTKRLTQLGSSTSKLHATRFKEELLDCLPELQAHKKGGDVFLIFKADTGPALLKASEITGALHVSKAADIIRSDILERSMKFEGSFEENCLETSVPQSLNGLVSMIEHSLDIETQIETETTKSDLAFHKFYNTTVIRVQRKGILCCKNTLKVVKHHLSFTLVCCCLQKQGSVN